MTSLDALDWLDVASFQLTRGDAFGEATPNAFALDEWLKRNSPPWRRKDAGAGRAIKDAAEPVVGEGSWTLTSLQRGAHGLLVANDTGAMALPPQWTRSTLLRWRLPLGTAHAAALAHAGRPAVCCRLSSLGSDRDELAPALADVHVHVGAILPFDVLFGLMCEQLAGASRRLGDIAPVRFRDSEQREFPPRLVLAVAALHARVLGAFSAVTSGETFSAFVERVVLPEARGPLLAGRLYRFLRDGDEIGGMSPRAADIGSYLQLPPAAQSLRESADPLWDVVAREQAWMRGATQSQELALAVEEYLRCKCLLHGALTQGARSGLSEFLMCSERLRGLRNVATESKADVVRIGLGYLGAGKGTDGVELRTSEQGERTAAGCDREVARSLDRQFEGFIEGRPAWPGAAVSWPICLIRTDHVNVDVGIEQGLSGALSAAAGQRGPMPSLVSADARRVRFDMTEYWALAESVVTVLDAVPEGVVVIPGFDVAGAEETVPNWWFALLYALVEERLGGRVQLTYRVHAGESYRSPVEGLRRIHEAACRVTPPRARPRIGHGLALYDPKWDDELIGRQELGEALDDLVWIWGRLRDDAAMHGDLLGCLAAKIRSGAADAGLPVEGDEDDVARTYWEAYQRRFSVADMTRLGLLQRSQVTGWPRVAESVSLTVAEDAADRVVIAYLTSGALRRPVGELLDLTWLREGYDATQDGVVADLLERRAVIEVCPTSNLVIAAIQGYRAHPVGRMVGARLDVTINTDDPGLFGVELAEELTAVKGSLAVATGSQHQAEAAIADAAALSLELMRTAGDTTIEQAIAALREHWRERGHIAQRLPVAG